MKLMTSGFAHFPANGYCAYCQTRIIQGMPAGYVQHREYKCIFMLCDKCRDTRTLDEVADRIRDRMWFENVEEVAGDSKLREGDTDIRELHPELINKHDA